MKKHFFVIAGFCVCLAVFAQPKAYKLWYRQPAKDWNEALPIGNGRLGAMVFGGAKEELLQLNEQTLWTGGPVNKNPNPEAPQYLQPVRAALFADSINEAVKLLQKMQGPDTEMYQPLGDLIIRQQADGEPSAYRRELDISTAVATTRYTINGVNYSRDVFSSAPDQVIVIRLRSSRPGALHFTVGAAHPLAAAITVEGGRELVLRGKARITNDEGGQQKPLIYEDAERCDGMRFQFRVKAIAPGAVITAADTVLQVEKATEVLLLLSAATSFNGINNCPDKGGLNEETIAKAYLKGAEQKTFAQLLQAHRLDYHRYFNRLSVSFSNTTGPDKPTDARLADYRNGLADPWLEEMYFQFGRYLLISCSRPGGWPANLQGIWNNSIRPPWRSNYTTNINLQMNYWPAGVTNLNEMNEALVEHIQRLAVNGRATAQNYYNMRGWAVHHNTDLWAQTNPVGEGTGDPKWANWSLGSPWLSQHLWEHYRFTGNKSYLQKTAYPLMKEAALFCLDWLVEKDGVLVTAPSTSPENVYLHPQGFKGTVTIASAMDMEIIWDLFQNVREAAAILNTDADFASLLKEKQAKLSPLKIGKKGNLVEWYGDWEDEDPQHRHVSHLFGLHPGRQISPLLDPAYANAAKNTLLVRGDGGTGWSKAWKINFWARLLDGDHAYKMYGELLKHSTLKNLFDTHPPFQIDGNFGATAGVAEMLLQSHLDFIQLLPALPMAWKEGHARGLLARGAFEVDLYWSGGRLQKAVVLSKRGGECRVLSKEPLAVKAVSSAKSAGKKSEGRSYFLTSFPTSPGKKYELIVK